MFAIRQVSGVLAIFVLAGAALGEFVPGRIYTSGIAGPSHLDPGIPGDAIFELDPLTGTSREFGRLPFGLTGSMTGLAFTPDGTRLRASAYYADSIVEFDGDGNVSVALGPADGIVGPYGSNNITYGPNGDFFVGAGLSIRRFPAGGGPGEILADHTSAPMDPSPALACGPDGSLYYMRLDNPGRIFRIAPEGGVSLFDTLPAGRRAISMTIASDGTIYAMGSMAMFRYENGDATSRQTISDFGPTGASSITMSPDEESIIISANNGIYSMDADDGEWSFLGAIQTDGVYVTGSGVAVNIPEPGSAYLACSWLACLVYTRSLRRRLL